MIHIKDNITQKYVIVKKRNLIEIVKILRKCETQKVDEGKRL